MTEALLVGQYLASDLGAHVELLRATPFFPAFFGGCGSRFYHGKSLVGLLTLLDAVRRGRRAILLEPLRAIAREKYDELSPLAPGLGRLLGRPFEVRVTTGDYRLDDEFFAQAPPRSGELIIATPERLDAIFRNPAQEGWIAEIGAVCLDEAHLISSSHRGPVQEFLITSLLCRPEPPRLILLSATMGNPGRLREWLAPCDVVHEGDRHRPPHKEVRVLDSGEDPSEMTLDWVREVLGDPETSILIFVFQTRSTEKLAEQIRGAIAGAAGPLGPLAYHAQLSTQRRQEVREAYFSGGCRCVVTTTALALGVNWPATHVLIRDTTFPGVGPLTTAELLQILGRAGRQDRPGEGAVLLRSEDAWKPDKLVSALRDETVPALTSAFERSLSRSSRSRIYDVVRLSWNSPRR
jgi:replicative superfamily II helicase